MKIKVMKLQVTDPNRRTSSGGQITNDISLHLFSYPRVIIQNQDFWHFSVIVIMWLSWFNHCFSLHLRLVCGCDICLKSIPVIGGYR